MILVGIRLVTLYGLKTIKIMSLNFEAYNKLIWDVRLNVNSLVAEVYADNLKSRNVFEKLGFLKFKHPLGEDGLIYRYDII